MKWKGWDFGMKNRKWFFIIGMVLVVFVILSFLPVISTEGRMVYYEDYCGVDPDCPMCDVCYPYREVSGRVNFWQWITL